MADPRNDHEAIVALDQRVQQHQESLIRLDQQSREQGLQMVRLETHISGLKESHIALTMAIDSVKTQIAEQQQRTEERLTNLDDKVDSRLDNLQNHFDASFDTMRHDVRSEMTKKEAAVPQWAQVRLTSLSISVAILGVLVAIFGYFHLI